MSRSCASYDRGFSDEAIRLAVVIRVLIHQTRHSTSLLTHLNATKIHLLSTCPHVPMSDVLIYFGLGAIKNGKYCAHLEKASFRRMVHVSEWWNEVVYVLGEDTKLTRREIVLAAANKDGGAHVDTNLTPQYEKLIGFLKIGTWADSGNREWRDANMHFAALRQMAYELLNSPELFIQAEAPQLDAHQFESQALDRYRFLMTERIRLLLTEVNQLTSKQPLVFVASEGNHSGNAAGSFVTSSSGRDEVHLDLTEANEVTVAHAILNAIHCRSGWPVSYPTMPTGLDRDADLIASEVSNVFYQYVINSKLIDLGFGVDHHREQSTNAIVAWPNTQIKGHDFFRVTLKILKVMLWEGSYKDRVIKAMSINQPEALELASEIEKVVLSATPISKAKSRTAMVRILAQLDRWITEQTGRSFELRKRVVVSPVLSKERLERQSRDETDLMSFPLCINDSSFWIVGLAAKSDKILIGRMPLKPTSSGAEPEAVAEIRSLWKTHSLRELLAILGIRFGDEN